MIVDKKRAQTMRKFADAQQLLAIASDYFAERKYDDAEACIDELEELLGKIGVNVHLEAVEAGS